MPDLVSRRASLRLSAASYSDIAAICSVTVGVKARVPVFAHRLLAAETVDVLRRHSAQVGVTLWAYCVMPDHGHLVLTPSATCDIVSFVGQFKSLSLRAAWKLGVDGSFWQPRFWDHFARKEDEAKRVILYVLQNPVRAGLVAQWHDYAFSGAPGLPQLDEKCGGQAPALRPNTDAEGRTADGRTPMPNVAPTRRRRATGDA
jgi:REP element-mobilizing transposase RayT